MRGMFQISSKLKCFVTVYLYVLTYAKHEHYTGWKSYYINTSSTEQVINLNNISKKLDLDFLSSAHVDREAVVLVKPEQQPEFMKSLDEFGIKYRIHVDNITSALNYDDEINKNKTKNIARDGGNVMSYDRYQTLETIEAYMAYIAAEYSNTTTLVKAAKTFEGRTIQYLKISTTNFANKRKPVIFIEGGMHAREWIAPPAVTYAIKKLTENVTEPKLLKQFDWILMPVTNPDGYHYTFNGSRFWRKNRSKNAPNDDACPGVDGNRNFDIAWNTVGTSKNPCSPVYPGKEAFSDAESQVVRDVLNEHLPRIILFLSLHSYGSLILHPWAHNNTRSYNYDTLNSIGFAIAHAFSKHSPRRFPPFIVGSAAGVLYKCSGMSVDYAHHLGVHLAYTIEMPGFSPNLLCGGFHLETEYIEDICRSTWAGIAVGARRAKKSLKKLVN